jgi:ABC-2 type transport system ATP-binding protein
MIVETPPTSSRITRPIEVPAQEVARPIIQLEHVDKVFSEDAGVFDLNISVPAGTIFGMIGPSGCGKTTTVRLMTGLYQRDKGNLLVLGRDPNKFSMRTRERIGYMPQSFSLYPDLTARENVDFVASLFGLLWWRRRRRTRHVLELVDLWSVRDRRAGRLSGGMQRRLELASALVHEPAILFLDEPTAGIDPLLRATIWRELTRLRDEGRTLLITTQYVGEAEGCDAVLLISDGNVVAAGTPDQLRRSALGGDVVDVETADPIDASVLRQVPGVQRIEQRGPTAIRVTVEDAATTIPEIVEAITGAGGEVASAGETRPSYDEVFALLVEQARAARPNADDHDADHDAEPAA